MSAGGIVVWLTGLPSSGKSTLARGLQARVPCIVLDGDEVRAAIAIGLGYTAAERDSFYDALGRLAALLARQGQVVVVAATAHRASYRAAARAHAPAFLEVFVDVPIEECARRDAKGLYAHHAADLPGGAIVYEAPEHPDLRVTGGADDDALWRIAAAIHRSKP